MASLYLKSDEPKTVFSSNQVFDLAQKLNRDVEDDWLYVPVPVPGSRTQYNVAVYDESDKFVGWF